MLFFWSGNDTLSTVHFPYCQMIGLYMMINVTAHKYTTNISTTATKSMHGNVHRYRSVFS